MCIQEEDDSHEEEEAMVSGLGNERDECRSRWSVSRGDKKVFRLQGRG